jgi:hypothetical protein
MPYERFNDHSLFGRRELSFFILHLDSSPRIPGTMSQAVEKPASRANGFLTAPYLPDVFQTLSPQLVRRLSLIPRDGILYLDTGVEFSSGGDAVTHFTEYERASKDNLDNRPPFDKLRSVDS